MKSFYLFIYKQGKKSKNYKNLEWNLIGNFLVKIYIYILYNNESEERRKAKDWTSIGIINIGRGDWKTILEDWKTAGLNETSWEEKGRKIFNGMEEIENVNLEMENLFMERLYVKTWKVMVYWNTIPEYGNTLLEYWNIMRELIKYN